MSLYDNFRAPQYVDFASLHNGDITTHGDTSSFFDRDSDIVSTPSVPKSMYSGTSVSSFNGTFSDGDTTLTPSKFSTSLAKVPGNGGNQPASTPSASVFIKLMPSIPSVQSPKLEVISANSIPGSTINSPSIEEFDIPSHRMSTPLVRNTNPQTEVKISYASPLRESPRLTQSSIFASKMSNLSDKSPNGYSTSVSRKSRFSGVAPLNNRRSRSACSPKSTEEVLNDALRTLSLQSSHKKTPSEVANDVDQSSSPALAATKSLPTAVAVSCKKPESSGKGAGPKRKLSPLPKNTREYGQQPAKYISMAEQIVQIQKKTPKRFRTLPSTSMPKKGVQLKVAQSISTQPKPVPVPPGGSEPLPSGPQKKLKGQEGSTGDNKGVRVARWPQPKVEPFVLTSYKKKELPKTVFNFEQKESVILRDRRTPCQRVRQTTMVQPFSFDKRDQEFLQRKSKMGSQGDENGRNAEKDPLVHHARVPTVLHKPPFVPQKKPHKATRPLDVCLNTEKRAKEREQFDEHLKQKEMERLTLLNKLQEEKRLQEEKETLKLRKELVHKARPVPVFHPFSVHPSDAPLTEPSTPKFLHRSKSVRDPPSSAMET